MAKEPEQIDEELTPKPKKAKGKSKKGLIIVLAVVVPLLLVGGTAGAAFAGIIKIPGLKIPGAKAKSVANYTDKDDNPSELAKNEKKEPEASIEPEKESTAPEVKIVKEPEPVLDPEVGAKKLAGIWNNLEPADIVRISAAYKNPELALVLSKMDAEKVAGVLSEIKDAKRAAALSQEIQHLASIIPETKT